MYFNKKNRNSNSIFYYLFLLLIFFIPINNHIVSYIIGAIVIIWLIEGNFNNKFKNILKNPYTFLFSGYFILYFIGLFYSKNISFGLFDLQIKLSLFIFPVIFSSFDKEFRSSLTSNVSHLFKAYILGCLLACLICLINATYQYIKDEGYIINFYYTDFSILFHPSYFSMYINFAFAIIVYYLIEKQIKPNISFLISHIPYLILLLFFSVIIILLSSKAGILTLVLIYVLSIIYLFVYKKKYLVSLVILLIIIPLFYSLFFIFTYSLKRAESFQKALASKSYTNNKTQDGTSSRILVWNTSINLIKQHPLFGVGTGDIKDVLMAKYKETHITWAYENKLNAHNQYLQTFIAIGILGFIFLLLSLLIPFIISIRKNCFLYFIFLCLIIVNLSVESMFERQAGVVFYAFFNSLLFFSYNKGSS